MDFLLIAALTVLNGAFAMSELALASSRTARLAAMAEAGDKGASAALALLAQPTQFLSSVQVGITSIGVLNGIIGEAAFSATVAVWLIHAGVSERAAAWVATAVVVTLITFITIVFGELVPKRIGQLYPELVARWVARPMVAVAWIAKPFVQLLSFSTQAVLKLLRIDQNQSRAVTEEEIAASLVEGVGAGLIEQHEHQMVRNVFHLDDRPLASMMVARSEIDWLDAASTVAQALERLSQGNAHSWYPVCRRSLDEVLGLVSLTQLLARRDAPDMPLSRLVQAAVFVPETLSGKELLEQFRAQTLRMVLVVDEYGVVQGLWTPRDLLEAITGELQTGEPADAWAHLRADGSWLLDGLMPVAELKARLELRDLPDEDKGRYNTVAGLLQTVSGRLPLAGERIACAGWVFEVLALDGRRIAKVLARVQH